MKMTHYIVKDRNGNTFYYKNIADTRPRLQVSENSCENQFSMLHELFIRFKLLAAFFAIALLVALLFIVVG